MSADVTDYEGLLKRAKEGQRIPHNVVQDIQAQLSGGCFEGDPYTLIHILGVMDDAASQKVIESYLDYRVEDPLDDGMVRRIALYVLARLWSIPRYFDAAATKAFDDPSPYVRAAAATILGHLAAKFPEFRSRAGHLLLRGIRAGTQGEEQEVWEAFYEGLLELFEVPPSEWPSATQDLTERQIRRDLLEMAEELSRRWDGRQG